MPLELLHVGHDVGDVIDCAVCCAGLQSQVGPIVRLMCRCNSQAAWAGAAVLGCCAALLTGSSKGVKLMAQHWKGRRLNVRWLLSLAPPHSSRHSVAVTYLHAAQHPCQKRDTQRGVAAEHHDTDPLSFCLDLLPMSALSVNYGSSARTQVDDLKFDRASLLLAAACQESILMPSDHV